MAYTIAQLAKLETEVIRKYVLSNLLRAAKLMEFLPFTDVTSLKNMAIRWRVLPTVAWRQINSGYTEDTTGDTDQLWEAVYALGGDVKFDRVFDKVTNTITDPKRLQMEMKTQAMAFEFNDTFINGDLAVDPDAFEGLKKRVSNMPARQTIWAAAAGAAAMDPTASVALAGRFFSLLEQAHYKCNGGQVDAIFMNEGMYYGIGVIARYLQASGAMWLDTTKDSFDRQITTYRGAPCVDVGFKADQVTEIITDTEADGTSGIGTSIYMASFDQQKGVTGIQLPPGLEVYDPLKGGEQEATPTNLMRLEWWVGLANFGSYGIDRIANLEGSPSWT